MDISLGIEYLILTLILSFSTIQIVSSIKDKDQIRILKNKNLTIVLAGILIILSYGWFFTIRDRNIQSYMEGLQISGIFMIGTFFSLVVTKITKRIYGHH